MTQHLTRLISLWMRDEGHTLIAFHELSLTPERRPGCTRVRRGRPRHPARAFGSTSSARFCGLVPDTDPRSGYLTYTTLHHLTRAAPVQRQPQPGA
ncbi:hypothetical protein [Streptomyces erythrochromogenes]|uniref:hypothetical protein n=1 Tax=Streptomyces erythrochromogenes TaxID=285574 RepID=UPI002258D016|nr:hypothetical protein [Streptomyces erythrochromogenes]MCX5589264.1 hypothetical protein [Streptomyces erythrochromogenes]